MISLKYQDGTLMTDHLNTFQGIINQLAGMNIKFEKEVQGLWLLSTLPNSWETFRTSLSNSAPDGTMNMDLETSWVIDSSASIHATPQKNFFTSYTSGDFGSVRMGNDGSAKAIGMGDVRLETSNGTMLILKNVKHILDIHMNLISIAKGKKCSSLYLMQARVIDSSINVVDDDSTIELWHNKLSHMSEKDLMILDWKNLLSNDHSRKIWVYTLKTKDQVLEVFKQFHAFVERQSSENLKCIRTDNGGEYFGPFDEYCRQHGIRHQKTPSKTPQLNGLVERMNRTLVERNLMFRIEFSQIMKSLMITCRVFGCKAFVHIPKNEEKKLVRKRDAMFMEDHTIQDIEKTNATELKMKHMMTNMTLVMLKLPHKLRWMMMFMSIVTSSEGFTRYSIQEWVDAMQDEIKSLHENHSYKLVKLPKGKRALKNKRVYRVKPRRNTFHSHITKLDWLSKGSVKRKKFSDDDFVILLLYVDDILIVGRNVSRIDKLKKQLSKSFSMKDWGQERKFLVLERFNMSKAKVVSSTLANHFKLSSRHNPSIDKEKEDMRRVLYALAVGSLMYAMEDYMIMRYMRGISKLKLTFGSGKLIIVGYIDSDMVEDVDNRKSTLGYLITFSGGDVSWQSRLQKCVALSTIEVEYIAATEACKELLWMKRFVRNIRLIQPMVITLEGG
ncbi:Retrovirus-related Pol polyprotein from transposon TNT 1-94 [Vitis vinifera]|uniref:Retrovirus-related Pol polyprotein from transposon TNT 1-94 n=1 Tax=Vitis vinifera TaxID=29760 RepID=A0A438H6Z0_VITVI|nr:Retrovirus-related Pol polyprotein from transposon TNT 1-94 [Vitis vinifera]